MVEKSAESLAPRAVMAPASATTSREVTSPTKENGFDGSHAAAASVPASFAGDAESLAESPVDTASPPAESPLAPVSLPVEPSLAVEASGVVVAPSSPVDPSGAVLASSVPPPLELPPHAMA